MCVSGVAGGWGAGGAILAQSAPTRRRCPDPAHLAEQQQAAAQPAPHPHMSCLGPPASSLTVNEQRLAAGLRPDAEEMLAHEERVGAPQLAPPPQLLVALVRDDLGGVCKHGRQSC